MKVKLSDFIAIGRKHGRANLHVQEPGFQTLYVRYGMRWLGESTVENVLDIASVEVEEKLRGTGVFTRLIEWVRKEYPDISIYVENAAPRLQVLLKRLGFKEHLYNPDCFYMLREKVINDR